MMTKILILIFIAGTLLSCKTDKKDVKSNIKITMEEESNGNKIMSFDSKSKDETGLTIDLEYVLNKLNKEQIIDTNQILFYIDGTNGNIVISGFNQETKEVFDNKGIWIELSDIWEENDNAYDFDEIVISSIKKSLNSEVGKFTKKKYQVFYQTESDDAERIK